MRVKQCVMCGNPLPEGGRIDRRYCREACRVMAYRERHQPALLDKAPPAPVVAGTDGRSPIQESSAPEELATAQERIADLEAQCRALRQRAVSIELQHEATQRRLFAVEAAVRRLRAAGKSASPEASDVSAEPAAGEKKAAEPDASHARNLPFWMTPSSDDLGGPVPKWTLLSEDFITTVDTRMERMLAHLPELFVLLGRTNAAVQLRQWQRSEVRTFRRLARAIVRRVVCTELSERKTESQMRELVDLVLKDLADPHPSEDTGDKAAWAQLLANGGETLKTVVLFLVHQLQNPDWIGAPQAS